MERKLLILDVELTDVTPTRHKGFRTARSSCDGHKYYESRNKYSIRQLIKAVLEKIIILPQMIFLHIMHLFPKLWHGVAQILSCICRFQNVNRCEKFSTTS